MIARCIRILCAAALCTLGLTAVGVGTASAQDCGFDFDSSSYNNCSGHAHQGTVQAYDALAQKNFSFSRCFPAGITPVKVDGLQYVTNVVGYPDNPC